MNLYVVAYDITEDRARRRAVYLLSRRGIRIQRSVFEIRANPSTLRQLLRSLERLLGPEDSMVAYRLTTEREWIGVLLPEIPEGRVSLL